MKRVLCSLLLIVLLCLTGCDFQTPSASGGSVSASPVQSASAAPVGTEDSPKPDATQPSAAGGSDLYVHFIDCGQGDAILLVQDGHAMLVDAGDNAAGDTVLAYLTKLGVHSLDILVGTHPHADHIGGMDTVLRAVNAEALWMPDVTTTTKTFEDVLDAAEARGLSITVPEVGETYSFADSEITVLAPKAPSEDDLNNASIVLRVSYGATAFLLGGDAETESEGEMLQSGLTLSADVLKVGHHGSSSSTSDAFLAAVSPSIAVISCGAGNDYGHPHAETLEKLRNAGITILRTDLNGTVVLRSDGAVVSNTDEAESVVQTTAGTEYIGNVNSKVFHLPTCSGLPAEKNRVTFATREEAVEQGYTPCGRCNP